jgi:hypothetical protein
VTPCPQCGEPTEHGQLVCVNCGTRLALRQPAGYAGPPRSALPALVLLLAVVVIGAGAVGFALGATTSGDDDSGGGSSSQSQTTQTSTTSTETQTTATDQGSTSPLLEWPKGTTGYTVVLVTSSDHAAARRVALEAANSGLEAGLLRRPPGADPLQPLPGRLRAAREAGRLVTRLTSNGL